MHELIDSKLRTIVTTQSIADELFATSGYVHDLAKRNSVDRVINRAAKRLEEAGLIHEPDSFNGNNGFRIIYAEGLKALSDKNGPRGREGAQSVFARGFPSRTTRCGLECVSLWRLRHGCVRSFQGCRERRAEEGLRQERHHRRRPRREAHAKSVRPWRRTTNGHVGIPARKSRRLELFTGAFGELRNPKAHGDPTITDPLVAVEELMIAGALQRIVDAV